MRIDDLSRRTFLLAGGAVVTGALAGCGAGGGVEFDEAASTGGDTAPTLALPRDPLDEALTDARNADPTLAFLTRHDFDRWHGESFDLTNEGGDTIAVELVGVTDEAGLMNDESRERGLREPFSVQFFGPLAGEHEAGRFTLTHPDMGEVVTYVAYQGTTEDLDQRPEGGDRSVYGLHFNWV